MVYWFGGVISPDSMQPDQLLLSITESPCQLSIFTIKHDECCIWRGEVNTMPNHATVIGPHRRLGPSHQPFAISPDNIQSVGPSPQSPSLTLSKHGSMQIARETMRSPSAPFAPHRHPSSAPFLCASQLAAPQGVCNLRRRRGAAIRPAPTRDTSPPPQSR